MSFRQLKIIISGGGTGGHIFPAISIADGLKRKYPECEILFVGAEGKMEMEKVPQAGYQIVGLPIQGFQRKFSVEVLRTIWKFIKSLWFARKLLKKEQPDVVIGVGGYASAAVLFSAKSLGIPGLIQEQNSYPGMTNRFLRNRVQVVCVAYKDMERFFPKEKIRYTGNPTRQDLLVNQNAKEEGYVYYNLDSAKKTILLVGGSLGALTLNKSVQASLEQLAEEKDVQVIWQCGQYYYKKIQAEVQCPENVKLYQFLDRMDYAYAVADLVISRAGASSISELSLLGKPTILVPSPNVSEDHQTKNAMALVKESAAILVKDSEAEKVLMNKALELVFDDSALQALSQNVQKMAMPNASGLIVEEVAALLAR